MKFPDELQVTKGIQYKLSSSWPGKASTVQPWPVGGRDMPIAGILTASNQTTTYYLQTK